jgi:hypothetical protein
MTDDESGTYTSVVDRFADLEEDECEWYFDEERGEALADCVGCGESIKRSHSSDERRDEAFKLKYVDEHDSGYGGTRLCGWVCSSECLVAVAREVDTDTNHEGDDE